MKARFFAIAALVLGLASCQKDFAPEANLGGEVDYRLSVSAPELVMTRAAENGTNDNQNALDSAYGAVDYFQGAGWDSVDLRYTLEVYDADDKGNATSETPVKDRMVKVYDSYEQASFDLRLIQNRNYRFVVFADFVAEGATDWLEADQLTKDGLNHSFPKTLKEIALINEQINNESADAYFAGKHIVPTNASKNEDTIELTRPYAKVRVVATDLAELNNNSTPAKVLVKYYAPNAQVFNAVDGTISGVNTEKFERTYEESDKYTAGYDAYTEKFVTVNGEETRFTHKTLFTDYILAVDEQKPIQFDVTVLDQNNKPIKTTYFNTEIPVQRNYLTTIIGNVLTTATEINVTIDDNFRGYYTIDDFNVVYNAEQLQDALNNLVEGNNTIVFGADIVGNVELKQVEGKNVVIDGANFKYDGSIFINGNSRFGGAETVLFKNINFETSTPNINFVYNNEKGGSKGYAHNITFNNCTFTANAESVNGFRFRQGYNIVAENCVATGVHSLAQLDGCKTVVVNNVEVNDALEGGISVNTSENVSIKNFASNAGSYGIRATATVETTLNIENVNLTATVPVLVRNTTSKYTVNLAGENTLNAPGYQIVLTGNDGKNYNFVAPTGDCTLTGAEDFLVFPGERLFAYNAAGLQALLDKAAGDTTIEFAADIEGNVMVPEIDNATITLDGREYKYNGCFQINGKSTYADATTEFVNINFETTDASNFCESAFIYCREYKGNTSVRYPDNVKIKDCTFTATDDAVEKAVAAKFWSMNGNLVVENCSADKLHSMIQLTSCSKANVTIDGAVIANGKNGISVGDAASAAIKNANITAREYGVRADGAGEYVLNIEDSNITANLPVVARYVAANYTINFTGANTLNADGEYQVVFTTGNDDKAFVAPAAYTLTGADEFYCFPRDLKSADEVNALIDAGQKDIQLSGKYVGTIVLKDGVTLNGNNKTVVDCINLNGADNITIKGIKFDAAGAQVSHDGKDKAQVKANIISPKASVISGSIGVVIEDCTFAGAYGEGDFVSIAFTDRSRKSGGSGKITVKGCTFATSNAHYDIYAYYSGNGYLNIENNSFKSQHLGGDYDVYLGRYQSSTPVVVNGNAFHIKKNIEEAVCIQMSSGTYVAPNASDNTFAI